MVEECNVAMSNNQQNTKKRSLPEVANLDKNMLSKKQRLSSNIDGLEKEGNINSISMSSKECSDDQLIHNEDTIESSDYDEVIILYITLSI